MCPAILVARCDSSTLPGFVAWGEMKVRSGLWVLIEGGAVGAATSGTVSARRVSIHSAAVAVVTASAEEIALAAVTVSAAAVAGVVSVAARRARA